MGLEGTKLRQRPGTRGAAGTELVGRDTPVAPPRRPQRGAGATTATTTRKPPSSTRQKRRMFHLQTTRRRMCCLVVLAVLVFFLVTAGVVVHSVFNGPKPPEEMWIDWKDYAQWRVARVLRRPVQCTYGGVRFFQWGEGVASAESDCGCWLHRCPPAATARVVAVPETKHADPLTVESLRHICAAVPAYKPQVDLSAFMAAAWRSALNSSSPSPADEDSDSAITDDAWIDNPLFRPITYPGGGATVDGTHLFATVPTCVQSARLYFDVPLPTPDAAEAQGAPRSPLEAALSRGDISLDDAPVLRQFECRVGEHVESPHALTDAVLRRATKYHPVTVVPALGLLVNAKYATSDVAALVQSVLLPFSHLLNTLAETEAAHTQTPRTPTDDASDGQGTNTSSSPAEARPLFSGWNPTATHSWLHSPRQVLFIEDVPDSEAPYFPTAATAQVARGFAHSFSTSTYDTTIIGDFDGESPISTDASVPPHAAFFHTAPVSRVRHGEKSREPMYCFCQSLTVPRMELLSETDLNRAAFNALHRRLNTFFGGLPLAEERRDSAIVTQAARLAAHPALAKRFWPSAMAATSTSAGAYTPRLLYLAREDRRVDSEAELLQLLEQVGFAVEVVRVDLDDVPQTPMTSADWYHVGRYADVVMGSHGMGLTHAAWMDNTVVRDGHEATCRTLVELLPFADATAVKAVHGHMMDLAGIRYVSIAPIDVRFGEHGLRSPSEYALAQQARRGVASTSWSASQQRKIKRMWRELRANKAHAVPRVEFHHLTAEDANIRETVTRTRRMLKNNMFGPFDLPGFQDQTAVYDWDELKEHVAQLYRNVTACLSV